MSVLVYAEHDGSAILNASLAASAAARELNSDVHALVCGEDCRSAAEAAAAVDGVARVLLADSPAQAHGLAEPIADLPVDLAGRYDAILRRPYDGRKEHPPAGRRAPRRRSDFRHNRGRVGGHVLRPIYAGNAIATVRTSDAKKVVTVRATAPGQSGQAWFASSRPNPTAPRSLPRCWPGSRTARRPDRPTARATNSGSRPCYGLRRKRRSSLADTGDGRR